ncbi:HIRAN domain-containing protein [Jeotgalibaca sp. MA1X17-3]|uniref:HIRAN domain-containing protein n=1 Tax=Jeotgalibaca sp. MA1X17-3 TaxID=2908211 RepID=UPI001F434FE9|nr:HIRAN domain-containing protein [Jeotgalibaca sp. MA1X17-3]UJF15431.1 HIRAN domain-containing protein [Jeotgalibaca sp. MA1X17-3]
MIWHQIIDNWKQDYQDLDQDSEDKEEISEYWELRFKRYEEIIRSIEIFLNKPKWNLISNKELANPTESDYLIVTVLQFMEMTPEINIFIPILRRNPLGLHLLDFFLINHPNTYFMKVCDYLKQLLNKELFTLTLEFDEEELPETHDLFRVNMWLETLFELMIEKDLYDEEWLLKGIHYYQPKIRRIALQGLKKNREKWNEKVLGELEALTKLEKNRKNSNLLRFLLDPEAEAEKERKFLKVENPVIKKSSADRKLLDTYITGAHQHDLSVIDVLIRKGSLLQLVRDKDHELDRHAIAVTLENGYLLGYIPRIDNRVLANLLENNDILYAIMTSEDIYEADPRITIMLRQRGERPPQKEKISSKNIVQFPQSKISKK